MSSPQAESRIQLVDAVPFIALKNVSRQFGRAYAVRDVTLDLATPGEIHALVGENGAGKSTCLGLASGRLVPTDGDVLIRGNVVRSVSPRTMLGAGVRTIYQELTVVPTLSPLANVFLGQNISTRGWLRTAEMTTRYQELCDRIGVELPVGGQAGHLSVAQQQLLEIMRALMSDARAILLDEPTASLAEHEREVLFRTLQRLRSDGIALTLVSHNLDEVLANADRVTVFTDGNVVEQRSASLWTKKELVSAMLGNRGSVLSLGSGSYQERVARPKRSGSALLQVRGLSSPAGVTDVTFDLRPGEILGIAGLVGSGRTEILRALAGLDSAATGEVVTLDGASRVPRSSREARSRGIALLPEDRKGQGLVLSASASDNVALGEWRRHSRVSFVSRREVSRSTKVAAERVRFNGTRMSESAASFSGGNQQKLMLARWMYTDHQILLADEPTRGVDVGAKGEILASLEEIVASGRSIVLVSSELEEVIDLSDRIAVVKDGQVLNTLDNDTRQVDVEKILQIIFRTTDSRQEGQ